MAQTIKAGTLVQFTSHPFEFARVQRWTAINGATPNHVAPNNSGWHILRFLEDGARLCVHENGFRVMSNAR